MNSNADIRDPRSGEFVRLLALHERQLSVCVLALLPHWADAEEVLQETKLRLWEQFDLDHPPQDFGAWSRTIARYAVLTHRKKLGRMPAHLSEETLDKIAAEVTELSDDIDARHAALAECLKSLSRAGRDLLQRSYVTGAKIKQVATELGQSPDALYKSLERLRRKLHQCIAERLREAAP